MSARSALPFVAFTLGLSSVVGFAQPPEQLPRIHILATGGTIASVYDAAKGGFVPSVSADQLIAAAPEIGKYATITYEQVANIGSADMNPTTWLQLRERANAALADPAVAAIVVTHGTDTLEETAYFMDLTTNSDKPVVMVGSQRAASMSDTDGPRNLLDAVRVAVSPQAAGMGTMVVLSGQINAAREVTKTNTIALETFKTPEFGALGVVDVEGVWFYRKPLRRQHVALPPRPQLGRVEIVNHYAGNDGLVLRQLLHGPEPFGLPSSRDGLVIAGTGLGNVGERMFEAVKEALSRGIPCVVSTRVPTGRQIPLYASPGAGLSLVRAGCILSDNLSPQKARVLLMVALSVTRDPAEIKQYFQR
ncbi:MAG: asparaginase [Steroidobacteraceae bacterium]